MNTDEAHQLIRETLHEVAPEADPDQVMPGETLQEALDLDSIDFLNFVTGINEATGLDIPERDYPELSTIEGCVSYLVARVPVA